MGKTMMHALFQISSSIVSRMPHKVVSDLAAEVTKPTFSPKGRIYSWYADLDRHHKALHRRITALLKSYNRMEQLFKSATNKKRS